MTDGVWHQLMLGNGLGVAAKLVEQEDGRWIVTEMYLHKDRINASDLRTVQPARFEALANAHNGALERLRAEHQRVHRQPEPSLAELRVGFEGPTAALAERGVKPARQRIERPDGTDPDGFSQLVAQAYREYLTTTKAPATAIAEEADVPVGTVYRWIREARRRGHLPAGEKGRAG